MAYRMALTKVKMKSNFELTIYSYHTLLVEPLDVFSKHFQEKSGLILGLLPAKESDGVTLSLIGWVQT